MNIPLIKTTAFEENHNLALVRTNFNGIYRLSLVVRQPSLPTARPQASHYPSVQPPIPSATHYPPVQPPVPKLATTHQSNRPSPSYPLPTSPIAHPPASHYPPVQPPVPKLATTHQSNRPSPSYPLPISPTACPPSTPSDARPFCASTRSRRLFTPSFPRK